ncbi:MAG: hypothetical protein Q8K30_01085 [Candidatus Gracilibacteria bacterium]|nr:hypothetical protein [Candidatus Gracilibacteria bacterium]
MENLKTLNSGLYSKEKTILSNDINNILDGNKSKIELILNTKNNTEIEIEEFKKNEKMKTGIIINQILKQTLFDLNKNN